MLKAQARETVSRRCMVVYGRSLLAQGLASLLTSANGVEVASADMEKVDIVETINSAKPDVLVMDMTEFSRLSECFGAILKGNPNMRIVLADPTESALHIIQPSRRYVVGVQELISALWEEI